MSAAKLGRSGACGKAEARVRLSHAIKFLEVAELVESEAQDGIDPASISVAAALAILAGIASADSVCCVKLGMRSRGDDHHQAEEFLKRIKGGEKAAAQLSELISLKDTAYYGVINISDTALKTAMRKAKFLVEFAQSAFDA